MRYLSVCSGIEAATVAWHGLGWNPVGFSEIEAFPSAVLSHHYPDVPNFGDMTKFKEWNLESINLLVGGTPCQSFSVAGLRKGLEDPRGNLMLTYCGILDYFRPQWFVWENVPGVLSSNGGRDFGSFLGALVELGYGFSYRVFDAQYFGVAQRRRRVFVVGHFGGWEPTAKVLFESESLRGDSPPSRKKGQKVTECAGTLTANGGGLNRPAGNANELDFCIATTFSCAGIGAYSNDDVSATLLKSGQDLGNGCEALIKSSIIVHGTQDPCVSNIAFAQGRNNGGENVLVNDLGVRRLTPIECERLQGFPDDYTNIFHKVKQATDSNRYKALGNSMAVPVMKWIGERIDKVAKEMK